MLHIAPVSRLWHTSYKKNNNIRFLETLNSDMEYGIFTYKFHMNGIPRRQCKLRRLLSEVCLEYILYHYTLRTKLLFQMCVWNTSCTIIHSGRENVWCSNTHRADDFYVQARSTPRIFSTFEHTCLEFTFGLDKYLNADIVDKQK